MNQMPRLGSVPFRAPSAIKRKERLSVNWGAVQGLAIIIVIPLLFWGGLFLLVAEAVK
jgi:hypothetical protein